MAGVVALWAPEIRPPDAWLIPAVLYQERLATIAPPLDLVGRDGQASASIDEALGDLWEPLRFLSAGKLIMRDVVQELLPRWIRIAESTYDRRESKYTELWLKRVKESVSERLSPVRRRLSEIERRIEQLTREEGEDQALEGLDARDAELRSRLNALRPELENEKQARRARLDDLLRQQQELRRGSWGVDEEADRELRNLHQRLRQMAADLRQSSPASNEALGLREQQDAVARDRRTLESRQTIRNVEREKLRGDAARLRVRLNEPHLRNPPPLLQPVLEPWTILPDGLESLGWGKIWNDETFRFLATEAALWSVAHSGQPWAHSLIGPTWIIQDLLIALAEMHASQHPSWVLAGHGTRLGRDLTGPRDPAVAIGFALPAPSNATLEDAVKFRERHNDELEVLRSWIQSDLGLLSDHDDLADQVSDLKHRIAEPISAVRRALELDSSLGLRSVGVATVRKAPTGLKAATLGAAAAVIATPVVGQTLSVGSVAAGLIGGSTIAAGATVGRTAMAALERRHLRDRVDVGATRYLYEVGLRFDLT